MTRRLRLRQEASWAVRGRSSGVVAPPPSSTVRDKTLQPFPSTDFWNLPLADAATFQASTDAITSNLITETAAGNGGFYWNQNSSSHPIYFATTSDPRPSITDTNFSARSIAANVVYIPSTATQADPTDSSKDNHMHVIQPDGDTVVEMIGASKISDTAWNASRVHRTSLSAPSQGPFDLFGQIGNGTRAWGGSALGGLIRKHECQALADYINGVTNEPRGLVPHALAIAVRPDQLYFRENTDGGGNYGWYSSGTTTSADQPGWPVGTARSGFMRSLGYRWPATEQDYNAKTSYSGLIPTGALFAIPPSVDVAAWPSGTTTERARKALGYILQDYGCRNSDRSDVVVGASEQGGDLTFRNIMVGSPQFNAAPWRAVKAHLRYVTNDGAATPAGGALGAARRRPLAPEL